MEYLNLTKEIRKQLNFANQEFSKEIKKDKNIYNNYKNIGRLYQVVVKHLEYNWHLPLEFEFYKVAARFGFLQCEINSFQLYPIRVSTIQKNDDQLIKCEKQIQKLLSLTYELETKLNFDNNPDLYKEYYDFKKKITVYNKSWGKCELDLITAYYLNYAVFLLSSAPGSTETLVQEQVQQPPSIEDSIPFFTKPKIKPKPFNPSRLKINFL
ncbi:hypothetical protein [Rickettsiella endosymbiont of Rhagonycha lignosa]|uniref:hypothetical protein n=1 Tax=Rickettsiella endosymbiont of Rhagonycha lignosa TaxID=3077937 RepID=UPI00313AD2EA